MMYFFFFAGQLQQLLYDQSLNLSLVKFQIKQIVVGHNEFADNGTKFADNLKEKTAKQPNYPVIATKHKIKP